MMSYDFLVLTWAWVGVLKGFKTDLSSSFLVLTWRDFLVDIRGYGIKQHTPLLLRTTNECL